MAKGNVTYNQELVDAYDWSNVYRLYLGGMGIPQLMASVIPKEMGLRHRYQVVRILSKRYGDVRRKSNSLINSIINDYPDFGNRLVESAGKLRSDSKYYSGKKLHNKSKYANTPKQYTETQYMKCYQSSIQYANESSEKWRYLKNGYTLPMYILFTSGIMAVLSQVLCDYMYNQITEGVGLVLGGMDYGRLAQNTGYRTQ